MKGITILVLVCSIIYLSGCTDHAQTVNVSSPPNAKEILEMDKAADILQWNDAIFETGIEWVNELELKEDHKLGEITFHADKPSDFKNGSANYLSVGSEVYSVKDRNDILIIKDNNEIKRYLLLSEG